MPEGGRMIMPRAVYARGRFWRKCPKTIECKCVPPPAVTELGWIWTLQAAAAGRSERAVAAGSSEQQAASSRQRAAGSRLAAAVGNSEQRASGSSGMQRTYSGSRQQRAESQQQRAAGSGHTPPPIRLCTNQPAGAARCSAPRRRHLLPPRCFPLRPLPQPASLHARTPPPGAD
jgi:hypothetical protein